MKLVKDAAAVAALDLQPLEARSSADFTSAFEAVSNEGTRGVLILAEPVFESNFPVLAKLALEHQVATIGARSDFTQAGGSSPMALLSRDVQTCC
jgi:hypothetical protein